MAAQKLVSRILLPYKSIHINRDIFYDEMVLIFFMNTIAKPHVKKLTAVDHNVTDDDRCEIIPNVDLKCLLASCSRSYSLRILPI